MEQAPAESTDYTRTLASFSAQLDFSDLPGRVVSTLKASVLDTIGSGLFGATTPWGRILTDASRVFAGPASIWGSPVKTSSLHAALTNATTAHGFELDDLHPGSRSHPGAVMVPVVLALAQEGPAVTGREMLAALAAGYELQGRVGISQGVSSFNRGWHPTGTAGVFGAAAAAAKVQKLSAEQTHHALGIAGTMPAGLMAAQYGAMVKRLFVGHAAMVGILSADLAARGFTGIPDILDVDYGGYLKSLSDEADAAALIKGLGTDFESGKIGFKFYPCVGTNLSALDAMREILSKQVLRASDIQRVEIRTSQYQKLHSGWEYKPTSVMAAQMSMQYCLAVMIVDGSVFLDQFDESRIGDPELLALASRIEVIADDAIEAMPGAQRQSDVTVYLNNGQTFHASRTVARGNPRDPANWEDIVEKFDNLANRVVPRNKAESIRHFIEGLEEQPDVAELAGLLSTKPN